MTESNTEKNIQTAQMTAFALAEHLIAEELIGKKEACSALHRIEDNPRVRIALLARCHEPSMRKMVVRGILLNRISEGREYSVRQYGNAASNVLYSGDFLMDMIDISRERGLAGFAEIDRVWDFCEGSVRRAVGDLQTKGVIHERARLARQNGGDSSEVYYRDCEIACTSWLPLEARVPLRRDLI